MLTSGGGELLFQLCLNLVSLGVVDVRCDWLSDLAPLGSGLGDDCWCYGEVVMVVIGGDEVAVDAM